MRMRKVIQSLLRQWIKKSIGSCRKPGFHRWLPISQNSLGQVGQLNGELEQLLQHDLKMTALSPPGDFKTQVPILARVLSVASERRSPLPEKPLNIVRKRLISESTKGNAYWSAISSLTAYRSPVQAKQLPPCPHETAKAVLLGGHFGKTIILHPGDTAPLLTDLSS